jgi:hypothetical protein
VALASIPVLTVMGLLALRELGQGWAVASAGAAGGAVATTFFLYLLLGSPNRSRTQVMRYLGQRLLLALGAAVVGILAFQLVWGLGWTVSLGVGAAAGISIASFAIWFIDHL